MPSARSQGTVGRRRLARTAGEDSSLVPMYLYLGPLRLDSAGASCIYHIAAMDILHMAVLASSAGSHDSCMMWLQTLDAETAMSNASKAAMVRPIHAAVALSTLRRNKALQLLNCFHFHTWSTSIGHLSNVHVHCLQLTRVQPTSMPDWLAAIQ